MSTRCSARTDAPEAINGHIQLLALALSHLLGADGALRAQQAGLSRFPGWSLSRRRCRCLRLRCSSLAPQGLHGSPRQHIGAGCPGSACRYE